MSGFRGVLFAGVVLVSTGCFHATIETGARPSTQVIEQPWAASWIFGLVPPKTVETASQCPNGVARVETQMTFLNGVVRILTFNIFTPMTITVTCASGGSSGDGAADADVVLPEDATAAQRQRALQQAALRSAEEGTPILVRL